MQKTIGTFMPLRSLRSTRIDAPNGTFAMGELFVDWLVKTGQRAWQMLPVSEVHLEPGSATKHAASPYKGYGVGIDPAFLDSDEPECTEAELFAFVSSHEAWIHDYALFCAIRDAYGTDNWQQWPEALRDRDAAALSAWRAEHDADIAANVRTQCRAHRAFARMHANAKSRDITLVGDFPFYLPVQSPLVWANRDAFLFEADGSLRYVSGIPQTAKSYYGRQVWGHPLYRWSSFDAAMTLWKLRVTHACSLYDFIRIDHAKGFFAFGAIDLRTGPDDTYMGGPGAKALVPIVAAFREAGTEVFVEDAGSFHIKELENLMSELDVPTMRILRFAYNDRTKEFSKRYVAVDAYPERSVAYTTTHDTVPLMGYLAMLTGEEKAALATRLGVAFTGDDNAFAAAMRDLLIAGPTAWVIVPLQDWLLIPDRINVPGTEKEVGDDNWRWRMAGGVEGLPKGIQSMPRP